MSYDPSVAGGLAYLIGILGGAFIALVYGLIMFFYLGSPTGTALVIIYIFLKFIGYILFKFKKQEAYLKLLIFNRKAFKVILIVLIILLIKYIFYPHPFDVYVW